MAHLLRGKQAGLQNDLSAGLSTELFGIDDISRCGVNSEISCLAYDPVQSLLAVGTKASRFGRGQVYIFGRNRIQVILPLPSPRGTSVQTLQFCADKLICLDDKHDIAVFSLERKDVVAAFTPPGIVTTVCSDPTLDYALLGTRVGDVLAYDLDRVRMTSFKIPCLWTETNPTVRSSEIIGLQFHPRDIGVLLIGYSYGAVVYNFKREKAQRFYHYEQSNGKGPRLTQANWHPTGTFVVTGYEDGSVVFWDAAKDGRMLLARTLTEDNSLVKQPIFKMAWCAGQNPEDTSILIAGGQPPQDPMKGLTLFDMGRTPAYATSTWDSLSNYLASPKSQRIFPTPPGVDVLDFCLIPRTSPHYNGAHDPLAVIAVLPFGELYMLEFPSGEPASPVNRLPTSLTLVDPFIKQVNVNMADRERWLGLMERRRQSPEFLRGGAEVIRTRRRYESRMIVQAVHSNGSVRLYDIGQGDEVENCQVLQVDVGRAVQRFENIAVAHTSFASASCELAVGMTTGELVIFRWGVKRQVPTQQGQLKNISDRASPDLSEGLLPLTLLEGQHGPVTAVKMSDVGFVAAGYENGALVVIDLRGPAVIYSSSISDLSKSSSRGLRRKSSIGHTDWVTRLEFSVMMLEGEDYSSILLHVGTNLGRLGTFKILPSASGQYTVELAGSVSLDSKIVQFSPIRTDSGKSAAASQAVVGSLRNGLKVSGVLIAVSQNSVHIFKPASSKGAHKTFDSALCENAGVVRHQDQGYALVCLFSDGTARAYSIPSLRELASLRLGQVLDAKRFHEATVAPTGHIVGFAGPSELAVVSVWGDVERPKNPDKLFNVEATIPPRPTISAVQWVTGTQYLTPLDLDVLIGGPERPPSKRMLAEAEANRPAPVQGTANQEGYWAYMQRQVTERTQNLNLMGDTMSDMEEASATWAKDVNKFVNQQKKKAVTGMIKSKFGF
ncbi:putative snare-dependent exocytosis protein [Piedraia hortae CBS 480.64]|uniref:Putative snare-dependent exocytosis protein n=1 Tax=Piedraia hortae CBS 480.64 TaxID=1314780 RepID=A0A6A7C9G0_9PEZI|nr:putative snare-dependent exocytosis protein [Piedraia hortae CBS 480.64]